MVIDQKVAQVAADVGVSEGAALKRTDDRVVIELAGNTAQTWQASQVADEVAGGVAVPVSAADAGQLVLGLAMAVGQMLRQAYGELPASAESRSTRSAKSSCGNRLPSVAAASCRRRIYRRP